MKYWILVLVALIGNQYLFAQQLSFKNPDVLIHHVPGEVVVDGDPTDEVWKHQIAQSKPVNFIQSFPYDTSVSKTKTEFYLASNQKFLYALFICHDRNPSKAFVVQNLKRDFSVVTNDAVVLSISPFNDGQNGFSFGVTPFNAQREGAIENGGGMGVTTAWDQVWYSQTKFFQGYWVAEMAIPLSSIRFVKGAKHWIVNVSRIDLKNNEISNYSKVPRNFNISTLVFGDTAIWEKPIETKSRNFVGIPYISSQSVSKDPSTPFTHAVKYGVDAKIGITSGLNLDLTYNPDFAQVDVDVQQLNLTRYNLYFPERRQFFIENSDLFANFGFRQIRPFFSRKIGLRGTSATIPIEYGARVSGKLSNSLRIGAMNLRTASAPSEDKLPSLAAVNYSVVALQKKVFTASNIGLIWVHDQVSSLNYNSVLGAEYNLNAYGNKLTGKGFIQKSFYPGVQYNRAFAHATWLYYNNLNWRLMWNHEYVSRLFQARTGFVPRVDNYDPSTKTTKKFSYWRLEPQIKRVFYPKKNKYINNYDVFVYNSSYYDSGFRPTESFTELAFELNFQNSAFFQLSTISEYYRLFLPFSPVKLPKSGYFNGQYRWQSLHMEFTSNNRKRLNGVMEATMGNYFIGTKKEIIASVNYRVPGVGKYRLPKWFISGNLQRVFIDFNDSGKYTIDLLGLKVEHSFNTTTYLTGYWQLNAQSKYMNVNLRFQWRYRPMSDFFLVYSENWDQVMLSPGSATEIWTQKGRSVAAKLVYWF